MDAFHAQKCRASETPPAVARPKRRQVRCLQSRHSPVAINRTATRMSENPSRHTAIVTASSPDSRTSGPANEMPSSERPSTQYGFADIKKKEPVRLAPAPFQNNL